MRRTIQLSLHKQVPLQLLSPPLLVLLFLLLIFFHTCCHSLFRTPSIFPLAFFLLLRTASCLVFLHLLHSLSLLPFHHELFMSDFSDSKS
jgi:hypothetical protein